MQFISYLRILKQQKNLLVTIFIDKTNAAQMYYLVSLNWVYVCVCSKPSGPSWSTISSRTSSPYSSTITPTQPSCCTTRGTVRVNQVRSAPSSCTPWPTGTCLAVSVSRERWVIRHAWHGSSMWHRTWRRSPCCSTRRHSRSSWTWRASRRAGSTSNWRSGSLTKSENTGWVYVSYRIHSFNVIWREDLGLC